jgi:alpha-glucosidase (family GH31 glycosyl hydrolase)
MRLLSLLVTSCVPFEARRATLYTCASTHCYISCLLVAAAAAAAAASCRAIGGLVELYLFLGPTPEAVIRQYHELIGSTAMQPYWALGAHQVGGVAHHDQQLACRHVAAAPAAAVMKAA